MACGRRKFQAFSSQSHLGLWPVRAVACGRRKLWPAAVVVRLLVHSGQWPCPAGQSNLLMPRLLRHRLHAVTGTARCIGIAPGSWHSRAAAGRVLAGAPVPGRAPPSSTHRRTFGPEQRQSDMPVFVTQLSPSRWCALGWVGYSTNHHVDRNPGCRSAWLCATGCLPPPFA